MDFCRLRLRMKLPYCLSLLRTNVPIFSAFVCIVVAVAEIYLFDFAVVVHCFDISLTLLLMMLKDTSLNNIRVLFVFVVWAERYIFDRKQSSSVCASLYCSRLPILPEVILLMHLSTGMHHISIVKFAATKRIKKTTSPKPSDVHFKRQHLWRKKKVFHLLGNPTLRNVYSNCQTWLKFSNSYKCNFSILFLCVITFPPAFKLIAIISNLNI